MKPIKPAILVAIGLLVGAVVAVLLVVFPTLPPVASEQAENTDAIYKYMLGISGVIFGLVTVVLLYVVIAFRARRGETGDGAPIHGVTWLEVVWTAIPALIVISIVVFSADVLGKNEKALANTPADAVHVHVQGFRFNWEYAYTDASAGLEQQSQLVVPVNTPIVFSLETRDVIHSFWVPAWRVQMNTTPGQVNELTVTPTKVGEYPIVCAFLCGPGHADMNSEVGDASAVKPVRVVTREEYDAWVAEQKQKQAEREAADTAPAEPATTEAAA